jgi:hypothetical protein
LTAVASARARALLGSPISIELFHLIERRQETSLTDDELMERASEARQLGSVYRGDYEENVAFLRARAAAYEAMAEDVATRMEHWWAPLDRTAQVWTHRGIGPLAASDLVVDLTQMHAEASKPSRALWTSTFIPATLSQWLQHPESRLEQAHRPWGLTVAGRARVFEVHSPEDWWELAHSYPCEARGFKNALTPHRSHPGAMTADRSARHARVDPSWEAVAHDWDGVHVSMAGVMTAQDVSFERDAVVTELRGWDVESTVWLRWTFDSAEEIDVHH